MLHQLPCLAGQAIGLVGKGGGKQPRSVQRLHQVMAHGRQEPRLRLAGGFGHALGVGEGHVQLRQFMGARDPMLLVISHAFEAMAYFIAAYGLLRYMFADRYLTKDELFAAGAVFTLIAWGFAFLYSICQILEPNSFLNPNVAGAQSWLDLLFLSFSLQSATGLSDLMPLTPLARMIAMLQMFCGVMYLALVVSRLIALQYIQHGPNDHKEN